MTPEQLKLSIFEYAFSGKLVPQINSEKIEDPKSFILDDAAPFEIPSSWKWNTLNNCADICTGNSIAEDVKRTKYEGQKEGLDYIGTKDVSFEQTINYDNGIKIPFAEDFKHAKINSILLCIEGGSAGRKIAIVNREVCFGNKLCNFNVHTNYFKFVFYYLQSNKFKSIFADNISGIIGGVSIKKIKSILIPVPPLEEQKRIVSKIEELLEIVEQYNYAWTELNDFNDAFPIKMEKSILEYAISGKLVEQNIKDENAESLLKRIEKIKQNTLKLPIKNKNVNSDNLYELPSSWKWVTLGDCGIFERGSGIKKTEVVESGFPCVRYGQLYTTYKTRFDKSTTFIDGNLFKQCHKANKGDILMALTGENNVDISLPVAYEGTEEIAIGGDMTKFTPILVNHMYLVYAMKSQFFISRKSLLATGQIIVHISNDKLASLPIPLPPLEEQNRIVAKVEELLSICKKLCC